MASYKHKKLFEIFGSITEKRKYFHFNEKSLCGSTPYLFFVPVSFGTRPSRGIIMYRDQVPNLYTSLRSTVDTQFVVVRFLFREVINPTGGLSMASYQVRKIADCACTGNGFPAITACIAARAALTCRDACQDC